MAVDVPIHASNCLLGFIEHHEVNHECRADRHINLRILRVLAGLDDLEELHVRIFDTADLPSVSFTGFPKLRVLAISEHPSSNLIYDAFRSPHLDELAISHYPPQHLHNFTASCDVWARRFPSLRHLSFYISLADSPTPRPLRDAVAPLLALAHLQSASFSTWYTMFTIDDADIAAFADAWPRMRHLKLAFAVGGSGAKDTDPSACPTPSSILILATKCPDLKTVHIRRLEAARDTLPDLGDREAGCGHGLESFSVQNVEMDAGLVPEFAQWVDRVFPHLVPEVMNPTASWQAVLDGVKVCQAGRRQQKSQLVAKGGAELQSNFIATWEHRDSRGQHDTTANVE
uniref:Hsp70 n=1 Tax=Ganoderma boninense TaxID=34458 RepID=A0A5K1JW43_9APHY|nr:Hsp70 [Ganoderma boninense]